jgi:hypothetical protein
MKSWLLIPLLLLPLTARADKFFRPAFGYTIDKSGSTGSETTTTRQLIDLAGGWKGNSGLTVLGMYGMDNKTVSSSGGSTQMNRTSYGAGIGFLSKQAMGIYADAVYFINADLTSGSNKYNGTGYQATLGYKFDLSKFSIGLQFAYRSFTYTKLNGATLATTYDQTNLDPMFAFIFVF